MTALEKLLKELETPPHDIDVEQALIGAVLINNEAYSKVHMIVESDQFFMVEHVEIWEVMSAMIAKGHAATPVTIKQYLSAEDIAGQKPMAYLARLAAEATTVLNAPFYAATVRDLAARRQVINGCLKAMNTALHMPVDSSAVTVFDELEVTINRARPVQTEAASDFERFGSISVDAVYEAHKNGGNTLSGMSTGMPRLDDVVGGLQPSDFIIIGGRPAMGKTALGMGIGMNVARIYGASRGPVLISSLEMEKGQLKQRHLSGKAGVSSRKLRRGIASNDEMKAFANAERDEANLPVYIDHTGGISLDKLAMRVRGFIKKHGPISLLVIDYLQLMEGSTKKRSDNRTSEISGITTGLKALAKELAIPIIALSQLSREVEKRDDKRPILADLRDSGSIEQDADIVLFVYREEYYLERSRPKDNPDAEGAWFGRMNRWKGIGEVICAKNRHDSTGSVELGWDGPHSRFTNEPEYRSPDPDQARKDAKTVVLTSHGKAWKQILHDLSLSDGRRPTAEDLAFKKTLPANATLVDREAARALFYDQIVTDLDDKERRTKLQAAADNVRRADLSANFKDGAGKMWVYLPELIG